MKLLFLLTIFFSQNLFASSGTKLRIGWQVPWALQGQLVLVLKKTDILKRHGISAEFIGKNYGPELNELALAEAIDVVLTADQPAATLFAKNKGWIGVSRLMYNRTATYVPVQSPIKAIKDLKGKVIGVPVGAAAQRVTSEALMAEGIKTEDFKFINLGIAEHFPLIKRSAADSKTWDQFDALSGFDPIPAMLEADKLVRVIHTGKVCSLVLMNKAFVAKNPKIVKALKAALVDAYYYYKLNTKKVDQWFVDEAKLTGVSSEALKLANSLEPNLRVKNKKEIILDFQTSDYDLLQKGADFATQSLGVKINMREFVSNDF